MSAKSCPQRAIVNDDLDSSTKSERRGPWETGLEQKMFFFRVFPAVFLPSDFALNKVRRTLRRKWQSIDPTGVYQVKKIQFRYKSNRLTWNVNGRHKKRKNTVCAFLVNDLVDFSRNKQVLIMALVFSSRDRIFRQIPRLSTWRSCFNSLRVCYSISVWQACEEIPAFKTPAF